MLWFINKIRQVWNWLQKTFGRKNKKPDLSDDENSLVSSSSSSSSSSSFAGSIDSVVASKIVEYQALLEKIKDKTEKELVNLQKMKDEVAKAKSEYDKINSEIKDTKHIVVLGFWFIILMVVGIFIGYWILAVNKSDFFEKIENQKVLYDEKISSVTKDQNADISNIKIELNNLRNSIGNFKTLNPYLK